MGPAVRFSRRYQEVSYYDTCRAWPPGKMKKVMKKFSLLKKAGLLLPESTTLKRGVRGGGEPHARLSHPARQRSPSLRKTLGPVELMDTARQVEPDPLYRTHQAQGTSCIQQMVPPRQRVPDVSWEMQPEEEPQGQKSFTTSIPTPKFSVFTMKLFLPLAEYFGHFYLFCMNVARS